MQTPRGLTFRLAGVRNQTGRPTPCRQRTPSISPSSLASHRGSSAAARCREVAPASNRRRRYGGAARAGRAAALARLDQTGRGVEAGWDGFWLHRLLTAHGIFVYVLEPTSILVK